LLHFGKPKHGVIGSAKNGLDGLVAMQQPGQLFVGMRMRCGKLGFMMPRQEVRQLWVAA
jgi:hypothetical protein